MKSSVNCIYPNKYLQVNTKPQKILMFHWSTDAIKKDHVFILLKCQGNCCMTNFATKIPKSQFEMYKLGPRKLFIIMRCLHEVGVCKFKAGFNCI